MLYREIIAVCSQIHTKHINTAVWAERRIVNVELAVHIVTTVVQTAKCIKLFYALAAAAAAAASCGAPSSNLQPVTYTNK